MKIWVQLGFALTPLLIFVSQTAYPQNFELNSLHLAPTEYGTAAVPIRFTPSRELSRSPASTDTQPRAQGPARVHDAYLQLADLRTRSEIADRSKLQAVEDVLRNNTRAATPVEGNGIGAQAAIFHFGE